MPNDNELPKIDLVAIGVKASPAPSPSAKSGSGGSKWAPKPGVFTFYQVRTVGDPQNKNMKITKFNSELDVESSYNMNWIPSQNGGYYDCQCPASKFDCRHKGLLKDIELAGMIDSPKFYCFETRTFKSAEEIQ